jgi:hypothetical protein
MQIPNGKGFGRNNFCAVASFDENDSDKLYTTGELNPAFYSDEKQTQNEASLTPKKPSEKMGALKKSFYFLCGIEKNKTEPDPEKQKDNMDTSIEQNPFWSAVCDVNAIIAMAVAGFAYGFFNKFNN